jgi:hypothetical protein
MEDNERIEGNEGMEDGWTMNGLRIRCKERIVRG